MSIKKINLFLYILIFLIPSQVFFSNNVLFTIPLIAINIIIIILIVFLIKWIIFRKTNYLISFLKGNLFGVGLSLWLVGGLISFIVNAINMPSDIILTYPFSILVFFLVFAIFYSVGLENLNLRKLLFFFLVGSSLSLINGLIVYYEIYGIPDPVTLLTARYDLDKFEPYKDSTFGNSGSTATFLALVAPTLFAFHKIKGFNVLISISIHLIYLIVFLNVLIVSSRTLFFVIFILMILVLLKSNNYNKFLYMISIVLLTTFLFTLNDNVYEYLSIMLEFVQTATEFEDNSSYERLDAVIEGWDLFIKNFLFGIGPGMSLKIHSLTSSHQFHVNQALETGIIGLIGTLILSFSVLKNFFESLLYKEASINFFLISGAFSYMLYLILANGSISNSYNWVWIGVFAILTGLYFNLKSSKDQIL
jgi:hypothetical protein